MPYPTCPYRPTAQDYCLLLQVQKVTAEELEVAIQTRDRPLVIDFYATWCGPCLLLAKELEQVRRPLPTAADVAPVSTIYLLHALICSC